MLDPLPGDIFRTGQVLNNTYEIEGVLGRGGTGEVYRARNQINGRVVALKVLNRAFTENEAYLELMKREEEMRSIVHDAVVRYSDNSRSDDGHVFLAMDFVDGPSLDDLLRQGGLDGRELLIVAHRVAEGLVATHDRGVVHRDLSPDNIILRDGDPAEAVIIDFGIAKDTAVGARTIIGNDFAGKYEYAAPEQTEGRAEARSDLYALGASLLATYRGEVPFRGATPGEMMRRKQRPLDTEGVPEPLRGVIDWLTAPALEDRPQNAREVVARLEQLLRLRAGEDEPRRDGGGPPRWPAVLAGVLLVAIVAAGGGWWVWQSGMLDPPLPVASPYVLRAGADGDFAANAPDEGAAALLRGAYAAASGSEPAGEAVSLAQGVPGELWPQQVADLLRATGALEDWTFEARDRSVVISGLAADRDARDAVRQTLAELAAAAEFDLSAEIAAGPLVLPPQRVQTVLDETATCGPLDLAGAPDNGYPLGETIVVTGQLESAGDAAAIEDRLTPVIGDRSVRIDAAVLNSDVCSIRESLPPVGSGPVSIWLGNGASGDANLSGVYHTGENPVAEVHLPATLRDGSLWVMIVDNTGKVFHLLPSANRPEHDLAALGEVAGGLRRIRVLHAVEQLKDDPDLLAMRVTSGDYGKSEVIAILSERPLFGERRPRDESVASMLTALQNAGVRQRTDIEAIARRRIDARP